MTTPTTGTSITTGADQYTYSDTNWSTVTPATNPGARDAYVEAYDPSSNQTIMFGGYNGSSYLADTWAWNGTNWAEVATTGPPARAGAAGAYDPATSQLLLFGGNNPVYLADTWAWNGTSWTELNTGASGAPSARQGAAMAYYPGAGGQMVLFGGYNGSYLNDTWAWNSTTHTWGQIDDSSDPNCTTACTASPPARNLATMADDPAMGANGEVVLFGGSDVPGVGNLADTWAWNGTAWAQLSPAASPPARCTAGMAYDTGTGQMLLFGGYSTTFFGDTWAWTGTTWAQLAPSATPSARYWSSLAYDSATDQVVLFGGSNPGYLSDTWLIGRPGQRRQPGIGADGGRQHRHHHRHRLQRRQHRRLRRHGRHPCHRGVVHLDNGLAPPEAVGTVDVTVTTPTAGTSVTSGADQYSYSNATWYEAYATAGPSQRDYGSVAYDPATGQTILFGGVSSGSANLNDTWAWNGSAWSELNNGSAGRPRPAGAPRWRTTGPPSRWSCSGVMAGSLLNDTWAWNSTSSS